MKLSIRSAVWFAFCITALFYPLCSFAQTTSIGAERAKPDGTTNSRLNGLTVTKVSSGFIYFQQKTGLPGIRVSQAYADSQIILGKSYDIVAGKLYTDPSGEHAIQGAHIYSSTGSSIAPVFMNLKSLGGSDWLFSEGSTGGQRGVTGGSGLNNIGMLVKVVGELQYNDSSSYFLSDGMGTSVKCIGSMPADTDWKVLSVTGVCSLYAEGTPTKYLRQLYVTSYDVLSPPESITITSFTGDTNTVLDRICGYEIKATSNHRKPLEFQAIYSDGVTSSWSTGKKFSHSWVTAGPKTITVVARVKDQPEVQATASLSINVVDTGIRWTGLGPYFSAVQSFAFANGILYAATDKSKLFSSIDGGLNWNTVPGAQGGSNNIFASSSGILLSYSSNGSTLMKSIDEGRRWSNEFTRSSNILETASGTLLVGAPNGIIYYSNDGGDTWISRNTASTGDIWDLFEDNNYIYYLDDGYKIYRSGDSGATWSLVTYTGLPLYSPDNFTVAPNGKIYCGTYRGIFRSSDNCVTWTQLNVPTDRHYKMAVDSNGVIYAACKGTAVNSNCILRSTDDGDNWQQIKAWTDYREQPLAIAVNPANNDLFVGVAREGIHKSTDGGNTWTLTKISSCLIDNVFITSKGTTLSFFNDFLGGLGTSGFLRLGKGESEWQFSENLNMKPLGEFGGYIYCSAPSVGGVATISRSADDGVTWTSTNTGLGGGTLQSIVHNPVTNELYAVLVEVPGTYLEIPNLYKSSDWGQSWEKIIGAFNTTPVFQGPALKPVFSSTNRLFINRYPGLYSSDDGGVTWTQRSGMSITEVMACPDGKIYFMVDSSSSYLTGTYLSVDDGVTWNKVSDSLKYFVIGQDGNYYNRWDCERASAVTGPWDYYSYIRNFGCFTIDNEGYLIIGTKTNGIVKSNITIKP